MMQYVMAASFAGVAGLALHSTNEPIYQPLNESLDSKTSGSRAPVQLATDRHEEFVEMPRVAELSASSANALGIDPTESVAPGTDRFISHGDAALSHQFLDVAVA